MAARASDEATRFFALMLLTGLLGGLLPAGFHSLSRLLTKAFFLGGPGNVVKAFSAAPWWARLLVPAIGGALAGMVRWRLVRVPEGKARGFPEILEAVTMGAGVLRLRRAVPMALTSLLTFSSGGSVGREGSIVQVASAFASWLGRTARLPRGRVRMLVACGVAAGLAAAYRTPMAGSLFALEVIYGRFAFDELGPIVVAAVVATATAYSLVGQVPLYAVAQFRMVSPYELGLYVLLGLVSGLVAIVFQRLLQGSDDLFGKLPGAVPLKAALGGLLVGAIAVVAPHVCGNGFDGLTAVLGGRTEVEFLLILFAGKVLATSITVGSGGAGGVFTPTLLIGATLGGAIGALIHRELPAITAGPGAYALVGMGCLLAATTRAPIMAILMVFETTQQYSLILPLMLASIVSYAVARTLHPDSIYTAELRRRGIPWEGERKADILGGRTVSEIVRTNVPLVPQDLRLDTLLRIFRETRELFLYVGDADGHLLGVIDLHDIKDFLGDAGLGSFIVAADLVRPVNPIAAGESLLVAERRLRDREVGHLPVVESVARGFSEGTAEGTNAQGRYVGVITRRDLLGVVERAMLLEESAPAAPNEEESRGRLSYVALPETLEGRNAGEVGEEAVAGEVLAVRRPGDDGGYALLPAANLVLQRGDVLVVMPTVSIPR